MDIVAGIGILGCGTVGARVAERLLQEPRPIAARSGVRYELRAVAVRNPRKARLQSLRDAPFTTDARAVVDDPHVDVLIECIGGTADAAELVERALDRGRHVVSANKELLATQGPRLQALAASRGSALRFEAAVGGAVPILRTLQDALAGDEIFSICGVLNGTCTSILSAMESGMTYEAALQQARELGYAEADPSADLDGSDSAHKLAILAQIAFGVAAISARIRRSGMTAIPLRDVSVAKERGLRIRCVAAAVRTPAGMLAEVAPVLLSAGHAFARTSGPENVLRVQARDAGELELRGAGAGGSATASAILGDVATLLQAIGERHDFARRGRRAALAPLIEALPLFSALPRACELPSYPLWEDGALRAPVSPAEPVFS